jgi:hypothetical protein
MVLRWGLDQLEARNGQVVHQRFRNLFRYLRDNPDAAYIGRRLTELVVETAVGRVRLPHERVAHRDCAKMAGH